MKLTREQVAERQKAWEKLNKLSTDQHVAGWGIREIVTEMKNKGVGWDVLADMLEMSPGTLRRQYSLGGPIISIRHYSSSKLLTE